MNYKSLKEYHNLQKFPEGFCDRLIPPSIHVAWFGDRPMPDYVIIYLDKWRALHSDIDWSVRLWRDEDVADIVSEFPEAVRCEWENPVTPSSNSDIFRYMVMQKFGGFYFDVDVEPFHALDPLRYIPSWVGVIDPNSKSFGWVETAAIGSVPNHPFWNHLWERLPQHILETRDKGLSVIDYLGAGFTSRCVREWKSSIRTIDNDISLLPYQDFYPYIWDQKDRSGDSFDSSFAVHRWDGSWTGDGVGKERQDV